MPKTKSNRPSKRASIRDQINGQRGQLFRAQAVINCARFAVANKCQGLSETDITIALQVADQILDNTASALELVGSAS